MLQDYYQTLGVSRRASSAEIRAAFVRLVKHHHPDAAHTTQLMPHRLQDIQRAYRCLSDERARACHDQALADKERFHFDRQRKIRQRLGRYDRRHPQTKVRVPGWRTILLLLTAAGGLAWAILRILT